MNIDRSAVNMENLADEAGQGLGSEPKKSKTVGFGKKKGLQGPFVKGTRKGHGPSQKMAKATKTSGKFGAKKEGRAQGKGNNKAIR